MTIESIKRKLTEYDDRITEFVEKYRQEDDFVYYDVGEATYVVRANQFGIGCDEPPVEESEVLEFEKSLGVRLPEGYRSFLLEIGNGDETGEKMRGPWLCLLPFQVAQTQIDSDLSQAFPYTDRWLVANHPDVDPWDEKHKHGTLDIGSGGCTINYFLVVSGEERGNVWIDDRGADYGLWPLIIHNGRVSCDYGYLEDNDFATLPHVDFLTWYESWLDRCIAGISRWKGKYGREET